MKLPVEDDFNDIIGKAQKGQGINTEDLAEKSGVPEETIRKLRRGELEEGELTKLGGALGLNVAALMKIARNEWYPEQPDAIDGFSLVASPFYDMHVNAYLVWDPQSLQCLAFDTGTSAEPMIEVIEDLGLQLTDLFITHGHSDHIEGMDTLMSRYGCSLYVPENEGSFQNATVVREGFIFETGCLRIEAISTPGHTAGGTSFKVDGLDRPIAIVGDALFAGSMGGANTSFEDGLKGLGKLLGLPEDTVLAPGHGPLTTVGQEREMNCFFIGD